MCERIELLPDDLRNWAQQVTRSAQTWRATADEITGAKPTGSTYGWYGTSVAGAFREALREIEETLGDQARRLHEVGDALRITAKDFDQVEMLVAHDFEARQP